MTGGSGSYGSGGETGSIACNGTLHGNTITGPGTFGFEGTYTGDCLSHTGSGTSVVTIPTEAGPVRMEGTFSETSLALTGSANAEHSNGVRFSGTYIVVPAQGDCLVTALTSGQVSITGQMSG